MGEVVEGLKSKFGDAIVDVYEKSARRTYVTVDTGRFPDVAEHVYKDLGARLAIATGMDMEDRFEILWHFCFDNANHILNLRVILDHDRPSLESIAVRVPAAEWIEREMWELLGIEFRNHPDMRHLLLTDDWPEGKYPLRLDYGGLGENE
jgi:Ni,Fe-hydrogenase III component G